MPKLKHVITVSKKGVSSTETWSQLTTFAKAHKFDYNEIRTAQSRNKPRFPFEFKGLKIDKIEHEKVKFNES